jgi:hypothetical protein
MTGPAGLVVPCVLMRAGTSRGPFFLREWLPAGDVARDEASSAPSARPTRCNSTGWAAAAR